MRLLILLFILTMPAYAIDQNKFLSAIADKESGNDYKKTGPKGEKSIYQFKYATWRDYTRADFSIASTKQGQIEARRVAERHYERLEQYLKLVHKPVTVRNMALCWHYGMGNVERKRYPLSDEYSSSIENLYNEPQMVQIRSGE